MNTQTIKDSLILNTIRILWRSRELDSAKVLLSRLGNPVLSQMWSVTIQIAQVELSGVKKDFKDVWSSVDLRECSQETLIDIELVKGRLAVVLGDLEKGEDSFFESLLESRDMDYLLGKVQSMVGLGRIKLANNHFAQALDLVVTASSLVEKLSANKRPFVESEVLLQKCHIYLSMADYEALEKSARQLLNLSKENGETFKYVQALNHIAIVYAFRGDYKTAMPFFLEALDICKKINYQVLAAKIATNIATIHAQLYNYTEALVRYESILNEFKAPIPPEKRAIIYNNIGNLYIHLGQWNNAIKYFSDAETIADKIDHRPIKLLAFCQIARCFVEAKNYNAFLTYIKSDDALLQGAPMNGIQMIHYAKSKHALATRHYQNAISWGKLAIQQAIYFGDDETIFHATNILAQAYEANEDLAAALNTYKEHVKRKELLQVERSKNLIINTEIDYMLAAKEKEIASLQRENQLQSELIQSMSVIKKKNKELVVKNEELSYFARMIAIDFNKHLRVIDQFGSLLSDIQVDDKKFNEYLQYIQKAALDVSSLAHGLYKYATVIDDESPQQIIQVKEIFDIVEHDLSALIKETKTQVIYHNELPPIYCRKAQMIKVFKEIFVNSIQFAETKPVIEVMTDIREEGVLFRIKDNGVSIPEGDEQKIFWPFYRTNRLSEKEGNGLGLAACKKNVEGSGGNVAASIIENGLILSVFWPNKYNQLAT